MHASVISAEWCDFDSLVWRCIVQFAVRSISGSRAFKPCSPAVCLSVCLSVCLFVSPSCSDCRWWVVARPRGNRSAVGRDESTGLRRVGLYWYLHTCVHLPVYYVQQRTPFLRQAPRPASRTAAAAATSQQLYRTLCNPIIWLALRLSTMNGVVWCDNYPSYRRTCSTAPCIQAPRLLKQARARVWALGHGDCVAAVGSLGKGGTWPPPRNFLQLFDVPPAFFVVLADTRNSVARCVYLTAYVPKCVCNLQAGFFRFYVDLAASGKERAKM